jgi:hypothetical protein
VLVQRLLQRRQLAAHHLDHLGVTPSNTWSARTGSARPVQSSVLH